MNSGPAALGPGPEDEEPARRGRLRRAIGWTWIQLVRIRTRLLVINLVAVLVPVVGIHWARTFEAEGLGALETDMRHIAETLRSVLENNVDAKGEPRFELLQGALTVIAKRTRMRVRILDRRGLVVLDSHDKGPPEGPETVRTLLGRSYVVPRRHALNEPATNPGSINYRVEIRAARLGRLGTATRYHRRIKRVFLFLAMPVMQARRVHGIVYVTRSTIPVLEAMYRLRTKLLQVLGIALAITALMSLFFAATISRPLTRLSRAAKRLAAGDRSTSLRLERGDEIGDLSRAFATLLSKLDARARYISEFAANISHEFKTPLASMRGAAELLADAPEMDEAARQRFLGNILADVRRLDRLVSRLMELSRIEATLEQRETFDLRELVVETLDGFSDHPLDAKLPEGVLLVNANRAHLASSLRALLENAIRHSEAEVAVEVRATAEVFPWLRLEVEDRGTGISPANQRRVFDRFFTTESEHGGTGLGLAIVATVVQAHGGRVSLQSTLGAGTTFVLELPICEAPS